MPTLLLRPDISAVLFDVDGTLIDTNDFHAESWQRTLSQFGLEVPYDAVRHQIGKGGDQLMPVFVSPEQLEREGREIEEARKSMFMRDYLPRATPFPAVRELFQELMSRGMRLAVASSASGEEIAQYLGIAQIEDLIDMGTNADDAERSKPDPGIFDAALRKLGATAAETVVVGDTPYDAAAAKALGLPIIGVLSGGFPEVELLRAGCDEIAPDVAGLLTQVRSGSGASLL